MSEEHSPPPWQVVRRGARVWAGHKGCFHAPCDLLLWEGQAETAIEALERAALEYPAIRRDEHGNWTWREE